MGIDIDARGGTAKTALHCAASDGHIDVVRYLLSCGAQHAGAVDIADL